MNVQDKFDNNLKNERLEIASKQTYKRMLDDLRKQPPLLRPLAPKEMLELNPYSQKLFEKDNQELL